MWIFEPVSKHILYMCIPYGTTISKNIYWIHNINPIRPLYNIYTYKHLNIGSTLETP